MNTDFIRNIGNAGKYGAQGIWSTISSIFAKFGWRLSFTTLIVIIIFGSAITKSVEERSPVVFLEEFVSYIVLSDNALEKNTRDIVENPQNYQLEVNTLEYDSTLPFYKKIYMYPYVWYHNMGAKMSYIWSRIKVFFNLITNIWFLYMLTWVLYKASLILILQDESKTTAAVIMSVMIMVLLQMIFAAATYDKSESWNDMSVVSKGEKIMPFRGTIYMVSHIGELFKVAKQEIVDPTKQLNTSAAINVANVQNAVVI